MADGPVEEHEVAGLQVAERDRPPHPRLLGAGAGQRDAGLAEGERRQARAVEAARSGGAPPVRLAELARRGAQRPDPGAGPRGQRGRVHLRAEVVAPLARAQPAQQRLGLVDTPVRVALAAGELLLGPGGLVRRGLRPRRGRVGVVLRAPGAVDDAGQLVQSRSMVRGDHLQRRHLVEVVLRCLAGQQRVERVEPAALERRQRDGVDLLAVVLLLAAGGVGRGPGRVDRLAQGAQLGTPRGDIVLSGVPLLGERLGLVLHLPQLRRGTRRVRRCRGRGLGRRRWRRGRVAGRVPLRRCRRGGHRHRRHRNRSTAGARHRDRGLSDGGPRSQHGADHRQEDQHHGAGDRGRPARQEATGRHRMRPGRPEAPGRHHADATPSSVRHHARRRCDRAGGTRAPAEPSGPDGRARGLAEITEGHQGRRTGGPLTEERKRDAPGE